VLEPPEQRFRGEQLRAGGRQLERERQTVQALTDGGDRLVGHETAADRTGALAEKRDRVVLGERLERVLALAREVKGRSRGDKQLHASGAREQLPEAGRRVEQVLRVVEQEQDLPVAQVLRELIAGAERLSDRRHN
jgi:hypothetical protein